MDEDRQERAILAKGVPKGILYKSGRGCWHWIKAGRGAQVWRRRTKLADVLDDIATLLCIAPEELTTAIVMPEGDEPQVDTSDIPEASEEFFKKARVKLLRRPSHGTP